MLQSMYHIYRLLQLPFIEMTPHSPLRFYQTNFINFRKSKSLSVFLHRSMCSFSWSRYYHYFFASMGRSKGNIVFYLYYMSCQFIKLVFLFHVHLKWPRFHPSTGNKCKWPYLTLTSHTNVHYNIATGDIKSKNFIEMALGTSCWLQSCLFAWLHPKTWLNWYAWQLQKYIARVT